MITNGEVVAASFASAAEARNAIDRLRGAGYGAEEISLVADPVQCELRFDEPGDHVGSAALTGAVVGGGIGAGLGTVIELGAFTILGPIGALVGAMGGALAGALLAAGLPSEHAEACEAAVREGSAVVIVQTHLFDGARVRGIFGDRLIAETPLAD